MPKFADRVLQATATVGTGTITLGAALPGGYRRIADVLTEIPDGSVVRYCIVEGNNVEVGLGTTGASGTALTRSITAPGCWTSSGSLLALAGNAVVSVTFCSLDWRNACNVTKSAIQVGLTGAGNIITWDTETFDDGGWHDNVTNNSRLTVPAGIDRVSIGAFLSMSNVDDGVQIFVNINKNAVGNWPEKAAQLALKSSTSTQQPRVSLTTGQCKVVPGDYFEIAVSSTPSDASFDVAATNSSFWIESV